MPKNLTFSMKAACSTHSISNVTQLSDVAVSEPKIATLFTRHNIHLHALLLENQPWFCARDLGRLMGKYLDERMSRKLDADQRQTLLVHAHGLAQERLMISESGVYALLVYHYCPEYRLLREWLTHQVVPVLRDASPTSIVERPKLSVLDWPQMQLSLLHWQDEPWIRLRDVPCVLLDQQLEQRASWWRKASRMLQGL
ncbi:Prophage antirepressor [Pseudomonas chlororaphis subsp. aureofaciens]|nr:Prophage antirepressor [Pseudomonas chlororaphis subsp. aureofaciens]